MHSQQRKVQLGRSRGRSGRLWGHMFLGRRCKVEDSFPSCFVMVSQTSLHVKFRFVCQEPTVFLQHGYNIDIYIYLYYILYI